MDDAGISAGLTRRELFSSFVIGSVGLLTFGTQPVLLGGLARLGRITNADIGYATTVELISLALSSAVLPEIVSRAYMRPKVALAVLVLAISSYATFLATSLLVLLIMRGIMGLAAGMCVAAAVAVINQARMPDRVYALFYSVVTIPQAILAYLYPEDVLGRFGVGVGFALFSIIILLLGLALFGLKDAVRSSEKQHDAGGPLPRARFSLLLLATLTAVVIQQGGNMAGSAFIDPLSVANGFSDQILGLQVALQLIVSVIAGGFVAWYAWRWPTWVVLVPLGVIQAVTIIWMARIHDAMQFLAAGILFAWLWQMMLPFYTRLVIQLDPERRVALTLPGIGMLGLAIGPFFGSFGVDNRSVAGAFSISAGMLLVASMIYCAVIVKMTSEKRWLHGNTVRTIPSARS